MAAQGHTSRTPEQVMNAIKRTDGIVSLVAEDLGVSRRTILNWRKREEPEWREVDKAFNEQMENRLDVVEMALYTAAANQEPWAVQFFLRTQGKKRGYVERVEVDNMVQEEIDAIVGILEDGLTPDEFRKVTSLLAGHLG